ncbi:hypothetical protein CC80DRAFT_491562 [Byssothecium circinans]|uniref:KANL3/Tex30 alpha/beta hydrolase-like domain-containing protein n=1 Tax=Byssothecium circinans TaxID=147558 RepID=A0A6A5TYN9_9PLEO|nr:hypothetical protein CC80DRAFT_491562 [Byssothecium circinans]
MPPKRRKAAPPVNAPEPKRRATRSSTRTKAATPSEPPPPKPSSSTSKRASKPSKVTTPKSPKPKEQKTPKTPKEPPNPSNKSSTPETLTITHASIKNPIHCHHYPPSSSTPEKSRRSAPPLLFTHGAGGTLSADAVVNFCSGCSTLGGLGVLAFQGSMNLAARVKGFHACLSHLNSGSEKQEKGEETKNKRGEEDEVDGDGDGDGDGHREGETLVLGGRSMGARAAVIAATELLSPTPSPSSTSSPPAPPGISLILISYPLKGPKDTRDQILLDLPPAVRVLFIVGDRDAMCPLDPLDAVRKRMKAASQVVVVKGADHGMHVKPAARERGLGEETGVLAARWVGGELGDADVRVIGEE